MALVLRPLYSLTEQGRSKHPDECCLRIIQDAPVTPTSHCYFLRALQTAGGAVRDERNVNPLAVLRHELTFLPGMIIMHQTGYRKHFIEH